MMGHCKTHFLDRFVSSAPLTCWFCILAVSVYVLRKKLPHNYRFWFCHYQKKKVCYDKKLPAKITPSKNYLFFFFFLNWFAAFSRRKKKERPLGLLLCRFLLLAFFASCSPDQTGPPAVPVRHAMKGADSLEHGKIITTVHEPAKKVMSWLLMHNSVTNVPWTVKWKETILPSISLHFDRFADGWTNFTSEEEIKIRNRRTGFTTQVQNLPFIDVYSL